MKQFMNIFKFEFSSFLKNKVFVGVTLALIVIIGVVLSIPRFSALIGSKGSSGAGEVKTMLLSDSVSADPGAMAARLQNATGDRIELTGQSLDELTALVNSGEYSSAIVIESPTKYDYIVKNVGMYDETRAVIDELLLEQYRLDSMERLGISPEASDQLLSTRIESNLIRTGKDQMENFFYTYILIFALYMAILLYGQSVATSVASEKSSRTMELLITSAKTSHLMFGKVLGAGAAGLLQMSAILGCSFLFFNLNQDYWGHNVIMNSLFNMPLSIILYTILFFVLGYLLYSFLYGAVGSLASKVEDINTSVMPVTFLFIIAFFIVMFSMSSGKVDSILMIIASYVPFTSPMAMFTRIAMGDVASYEIILSVLILIVSVAVVGLLSARIYKMGVLLYGNPPRLSGLLKMLRKNR